MLADNANFSDKSTYYRHIQVGSNGAGSVSDGTEHLESVLRAKGFPDDIINPLQKGFTILHNGVVLQHNLALYIASACLLGYV
jgi:hypothetical protein